MALPERNAKAENRREIEELLARCLSCAEQGEEGALEQLLAAHPQHASVVRRRLELLRSAGFAEQPEAPEEFPERLGDFRLLERLGGGGMGVVYLAEQLALGRRVAIKLIRPEQLYFPGARARFEREAQAVARLAHPGIVQVHTVGDERGVPYIAMELVDGATLSDVLAQLRAQPNADRRGDALLRAVCACLGREAQSVEPGAPPFDLSWNDACVWIGRELAQALEHAHQRGVVHRDIKPSNVMVTASGRVLLVDFGLAMASGVDTLTRPGSALGSLPYMAPEQVDGRSDQIGPRTDVYGLSATLYELISLRRPFDEADSSRLRAQILGSDAPRLRRRAPSASADLEAVLAVAMSAEPERRYRSAADFARELSHVLAREPVEARHAGALERARRWAKRNPARALATAFAAVIVIGGPTGFGVFQSRAAAKERALGRDVSDANALLEARRGELERANQTLERQRSELAEALAREGLQRRSEAQHFESALEAVDTMLTRVGATKLEDVPQMEGVRRELLEDALAFYERFVGQRDGDAHVRFRAAVTERKVSLIRDELGDLAAARQSADSSVAQLRQLEDERFEPRELGPALASALAQQGTVLLELQEFELAEVVMRELLMRLEVLELQAGNAAFARRQRAVTHQHLAFLLRDTGRVSEALEHSRLGVALLEGAAAQPSADAQSLHEVGTAALSMAAMSVASAPAPEAEATLLKAVQLLRRASELEPEDPRKREAYGAALGNLGLFLSPRQIDEGFEPTGQDAESALRESVAIYRELVGRFPLRALYRAGLSSSAGNLCVHMARTGRMDDAREYAELGLDAARHLVELAPQSADHRSKLSAALNNVAKFELAERRANEALVLLDQAVLELEQALSIAPRNAQYARQRRPLSIARVEALIALKEWRAGLEQLERFDLQNEDLNARNWSLDHRCALVAQAFEQCEGDDTSAADAACERVVEVLRAAAAQGRNPRELARRPALEVLRGHSAFEAWRREIGEQND